MSPSSGMTLAKNGKRLEDNEIRVLIFTACYFVLDGVTLTIRRLEGHLRSRGATVKIVTTCPDDMDEESMKDLIVVPGVKIPFTHAGTGYQFGSGLDENTIREIERFKPNICHFTVPDLVGLDGVRWCQRNSIGYMTTWHSNYCDYLQYYFLECVFRPMLWTYLLSFYEQVPCTFVPTPFIRDKLLREGLGRYTNVKIWGRGCDLELFTPLRRSNRFRRARGIKDDDVVIMWVGRLVPEKRPDIWMSVLQRLREEGIPHRGLVVGHGAYEGMLASLPNVSCTGWLSGEDLAEAYASSDILLFPSDVETFGNVTLEALASGVVCVVETNCSGHLVEEGVNGYLVTAGDAQGFYEATKKVTVNHELRKEMGRNARALAWKWERNVILQQMAENYKDVVQARQALGNGTNSSSSSSSSGSSSDSRFSSSSSSSSTPIATHPPNSWLTFLCCDYFFFRKFANPLLASMGGLQTLVYVVIDAVQAWQGGASSTNSTSTSSCTGMCCSGGGGDSGCFSKIMRVAAGECATSSSSSSSSASSSSSSSSSGASSGGGAGAGLLMSDGSDSDAAGKKHVHVSQRTRTGMMVLQALHYFAVAIAYILVILFFYVSFRL